MKKLLFFAFAVFAFAACTQNDVEELSANRADVPETLTVGFEGGDDTRIQLNEAQKTVWTKDDIVSVFYRSNANQKWQYQGETGERVGNLKRVDAGTATESMKRVVVVYPYNENYYINTDTYNVQATLPATQHYLANSYGTDGNIMVSLSEYNQFSLKSVCGWLKLQLTGDGEVVKSIKFRGNDDEQVAGELYINSADATAMLASDMGGTDDNNAGGNLVFDDTILTVVVLDCGEGVELGAEATPFYISLPPQTFEGGFTVDVECEDYEPMVISTENSITIQRNHIQPMASVAFDAEEIVLCNEIRYTATAKVEASWTFDTFGANILSHDYNEKSGEGVITFDADVTTIGETAFYGCDNLTSITIPDSVTTIGESALNGCENLVEFNSKFASEDGRCLIIDGTLHSFAPRELTEYTIPDSVTTIGDMAFDDCDNLTSITIPDSVTTIGYGAFRFCSSLISITIPDSVTTIGEYAFRGCSRLTSVTIGDSVTTIGYCAFYMCDYLASVYCEAVTPPSLDGTDVFRTNSSDRKIYVPYESVEEYKTAWSDYANAIVGYDFSTTSIINYTTSDDQIINTCLPIISNTYSNGIGTIEFLGSIIPEWAFYDCDSLTNITIGDSVTTIGEYAFYGCSSLTSVTIPNSVTTIGNYTFGNCNSLTSVCCEAITPPSLGGDGVFRNTASDLKIYVPAASVEAYKSAAGWSGYTDAIVGYDFENGVVVE